MIEVGPLEPNPLGEGFDEAAFPGFAVMERAVAVTGDQIDKIGQEALVR